MRKKGKAEDGEVRAEYDFSTSRPNPYAERIRLYGSNLVMIEPELFEVFPSGEAVNDALRLIVKASGKAVKTNSVKRAQTEAKAS
jgi:hypothetical protein